MQYKYSLATQTNTYKHKSDTGNLPEKNPKGPEHTSNMVQEHGLCGWERFGKEKEKRFKHATHVN